MRHSLRRSGFFLLVLAAVAFYSALDARELYHSAGVQQAGQVQRVTPQMQGPVVPVAPVTNAYGFEPPVAYRARYAFAQPSEETPSVASIVSGAASWAPPIIAVACAGVVLDRAQSSAFPSEKAGSWDGVDVERLAGPRTV